MDIKTEKNGSLWRVTCSQGSIKNKAIAANKREALSKSLIKTVQEIEKCHSQKL